METIKRGASGETVRTLQRVLCLEADGIFGAKTEAAVLSFQRAHGLVADGVVGPKTWAALQNGAAAEQPTGDGVVYLPLDVHITARKNRQIKYLAIHYTAGASSSAGSARAVKRVFESRKASADFAVDDKEMVQFNPDPLHYNCWAVGDTKQAGATVLDGSNANTISIEICSRLTGGTAAVPNHEGWVLSEAALANAARLARILMAKYNIPIERVVRHYDITGKLCPGVVGWNDGVLFTLDGKATTRRNHSKAWKEWKKRLL